LAEEAILEVHYFTFSFRFILGEHALRFRYKQVGLGNWRKDQVVGIEFERILVFSPFAHRIG
jgi:hypothetical protein